MMNEKESEVMNETAQIAAVGGDDSLTLAHGEGEHRLSIEAKGRIAWGLLIVTGAIGIPIAVGVAAAPVVLALMKSNGNGADSAPASAGI